MRAPPRALPHWNAKSPPPALLESPNCAKLPSSTSAPVYAVSVSVPLPMRCVPCSCASWKWYGSSRDEIAPTSASRYVRRTATFHEVRALPSFVRPDAPPSVALLEISETCAVPCVPRRSSAFGRTSSTLDSRPPNSAGKPPTERSTLATAWSMNVPNSPPRWNGL